jgi:hypothetical protein
MKSNPRKKAVKKADEWMSKYIRARDRHCVTSGATENLTNSHLITRSKYATRWDEMNCHCQSSGENMRHEYQPEIYTDWWIRKYGEEAYHALVLKSNTPVKLTTQDILDIAEYYKEKYKELVDE